MNYLGIYQRFCDSAKNVLNARLALLECVEPKQSRRRWDPLAPRVHLIIPGGIWGSSNSHENTIVLTAAEQIIAYKLLRRIYPHSKTISDTLKSLIKARGKKRRKIPYKRSGHSIETRIKMSKSHRGKTFNDESKLKMRLAKIGKKMTVEHIANRVESRKRNAKGFSEATRLKMSVAAKNRKKTNKWSVRQ